MKNRKKHGVSLSHGYSIIRLLKIKVKRIQKLIKAEFLFLLDFFIGLKGNFIIKLYDLIL